ncbi:MAG: hypothetical protein ACW98D_18445, partial [Promethearchaeota archaeon]
MHTNIYLISLSIILCLGISLSSAQTDSEKEGSLYHLKSNLEYLASDDLEGRESTTHGEELAANYITKKLAEYSVKPYGDDGTYFQKFRVDARSVENNSSVSFIYADGETENLTLGDDFYLSTSTIPSSSYNEKEYEIIFAGYGITAEDYGYDSYNGVDVMGKVV